MSTEREIDFPIFAVHGDEELEAEVEQAAKLKIAIGQLSEYIIQLNAMLKDVGTKLNLYVNNVINRKEPFNYEEHIIVFNDDDIAHIYSQDFIEKFMDDNDMEDEEELFENLPETDDKYIMNKKQATRCLDLIDQYNDAITAYEYCLYEFNEYSEWYSDIVDCIKEELSSIRLLEIRNDDQFDLEVFDNSKHELIMTQDTETSKWKFVYIKKEDKEKFFEFASKNRK